MTCPIFGIHRLDAENFYSLMKTPPVPEQKVAFYQSPAGIAVIAIASFIVGGVAVGLIVHYVPNK